MEGVACQPYTRLSEGQVKPVCIVLADPARTLQIAETCEKHSVIVNNGAYTAYDITWRGYEMTLCSHGQGSPSAALCFEELIKLGALCIIKVGTCGSLQPTDCEQGDVVIVHSAVREEGVSALMVPPGYPAVADPLVFGVLRRSAEEQGIKVKLGMTLTSDLFYKSPALPSTVETFSRAKVDCIDMETATLFVISKVRGIRCGAVLAVDGSPMKSAPQDTTGEKTTQGKANSIAIVLDSAAKIASE
eukprot:GHVN01098884.1.p1 GENE.GHVN01098884.1~~GHVN01098884.1.p1  ORF type:complete len:279 (+),score=17.27 GHVN01098884.1:100-837(+)